MSATVIPSAIDVLHGDTLRSSCWYRIVDLKVGRPLCIAEVWNQKYVPRCIKV